MSYRNPEIITDKSGEILAQGFASFGQSMARGVATAIEKADQIKKQREAETARLRELQTEIDIESGKRAAEFKSNLPKTSLNTKLNSIIDERIKAAGDAQMDLYNESDPKARGELLKTIQNADSFLINTGAFLEEIKGEAGAWKGRNPGDLNKTYGVTGVDEADRANRLGLLNLLAGDSTGDIDLQYDPDSNSLNLNAYGKIGKENWKVEGFNSNNYLASGSELFYEIPQMTENIIKSSTKIITNPKGELLPEVVGEVVTKRIYQDVVNADGKKIGRKLVEGQIEEINQSVIDNLIGKEISASVAGFNTLPPLEKNAIFSNQLDAPYRSYNDFLEQVKNPSEQDKIISQMFKEKTIEGIGEQFESYEKDGQKVYFRSVTPLKEVTSPPPSTKDATAQKIYNNFMKDPLGFLKETGFADRVKSVISDPHFPNAKPNIIEIEIEKAKPATDKFAAEPAKIKTYDLSDPNSVKSLYEYYVKFSGYGGSRKDALLDLKINDLTSDFN